MGVTGEWPSIPPAPSPIKPEAAAVPEPPALTLTVPATTSIKLATSTSAEPVAAADPADDSPTVTIATGATPTVAPAPRRPEPSAPAATPPSSPSPASSTATPAPTAASASTGATATATKAATPTLVPRRTAIRRPPALTRGHREDLVWQPHFAYISGVIILGAFALVTLPLWIVLYRSVSAESPRVSDIMALVMMLLGGMLTCTAGWVILIEMRGRVRMVDTLARSGEREAMAAVEIPVLDAPVDAVAAAPAARTPDRLTERLPEQLSWEATNAALAARAEAQQVNAAKTLEASSKLLSSFGGVLKSFSQLHAQIGLLTVALVLFVGATILSLN